jgi:uroporphyrinogen-III synthase
MKPKILITREISIKQEDLCFELGLEPVVEPFINIVHLFINKADILEIMQKNQIWIFTSVNTVKAFFKFEKLIDLKDKIAYAIGEKTEQELKKINGLEVILKDEYANNFFQEIKKENVGKSIAYFCGNLSLEKNKNITEGFDRMVLYETHYLTKKVNKDYDAVAFFSPSAVIAFAKSGNKIPKDKPVFALGGTTMSEVFMNFQNTVFIPNEKKFESVMLDVKNYFGQ